MFALLPALAFGQSADLQITKSGPVSASGGDAFAYTLVMGNNGPGGADLATFQDTLPPGVTDVAASCTSATNGAACPATLSVSNASVSGTIPTFPNLGEVAIQVTGTFAVSGPASLTNVATIAAPAGVTDPMPASNTSTVSTAMSYVADLVVTKNQTPADFVSGSPVTYTVTVANHGPSSADGARLYDFFRTGGTGSYLNVVTNFLGCSAAGGAVCPANAGFGNISGTIGGADRPLFNVVVPTLPSGGSLTIVYTMTPTLGAAPCSTSAGYIQNFIHPTAPNGVVDPVDPEASAFMTTPAAAACPQADIVVSKSQSPSEFVSGSPVTYTITVANNGPSAADGANLLDFFRSGGTGSYLNVVTNFLGCTAAGGAVCPAAGSFGNLSGPIGSADRTLFSVVVPTFPVGGSLTIVYTMTPTLGAAPCDTPAGYLQNFIRSTPPPGVVDPTVQEASAFMTTPAAAACPQADLVVTKTQTPTHFVSGAPVTYTMTVANNGPSAADGARLLDFFRSGGTGSQLDVQTGFVGCTAAGGAVCPAAASFGNISGVLGPSDRTLFSVLVPTLPVGGSLTIVYTMTPTLGGSPCTPSGYLQNFLRSTPPAGTTDPVDQEASAFMGFSCADVSVNKSVTPVATTSGNLVTYTVDVANSGPADTTDIAFSDPLPGGFVYASADCTVLTAPAACGAVGYDGGTHTVSSTIASLGNGGAVRLRITGTAGSIPGTYPNIAQATVNADTIDPATSSNSSQVNLQISNTSSPLTVVKTIAGAPAGGLPAALTFTGTVTCGTQPPQNWSATVAAGAVSGSSGALTFFDGDTCHVTEDAPPAAPVDYAWSGAPVVDPDPTPALGPATPMTVNVRNTLVGDPGTLTITKNVSGGPAGGASGSFTFAVSCTPSNTAIANQTVTLGGASSGSVTVAGIPAGDTCTVAEQAPLPAPPAGYSYGPLPAPATTAAMTPAGAIAAVVTNTLTADPGTIRIGKVLSLPAGVTGPFDFQFVATCDRPVAGSHFSATLGNFPGNASVDIAGIPAGATCTVAETLPAPPAGYGWAEPVVSPLNPAGPMPAGGVQNATATNGLRSGSLTLSKTVTGETAGYVAGSTFALTVDCRIGNFSEPGFPDTRLLTDGGSFSYPNVAPGATCSVTEGVLPATGGPQFAYQSPLLPAAVVIADGTPASLDVRNPIALVTGALTVNKIVVGQIDGYVPGSTFPITTDCRIGGVSQAGFPDTRNLADGQSHTYAGVPAGAACSATEDSVPATSGVQYAYDAAVINGPVEIVANASSSLTVQNPIRLLTGSVTLSKTVSGATVGYLAGSTFPIRLACTDPSGTPITPAAANLVDGGSRTFAGLPNGSRCSASEGGLPGTSGGQYVYATPLIGPDVSVATDADRGIAVTNPIELLTGRLTVTKTVTGGPAGYAGRFPIRVACTIDGAVVGGILPADTQNVDAGQDAPGSATFDNIPRGATCTVAEGALPAPPANHVWATPQIAQPATIGAVTAGASVANRLTRIDAPFFLRKTVAGGPAAGVSGRFSFDVDCGEAGRFVHTVALNGAASGSVRIDDLPAGAVCTFREAAGLPAAPPGFAWTAPPPAQTVTIDGRDVGFINTLEASGEGAPEVRPVPLDPRTMLLGIALGVLGLTWVHRRRSAARR
ncbi:DUF5979 domain-containing protein [Dokdonella ginsengisoli]|uniref:DUF5979 domain-containing protein n=1 Tax=Dokdonella ginsengisoli TaxID=363846 RepID=A0ABV9QRL7_9GAMM